MEALNEARGEKVGRLKVTERERDNLEGAKKEAEGFIQKERDIRRKPRHEEKEVKGEEEPFLRGLPRWSHGEVVQIERPSRVDVANKKPVWTHAENPLVPLRRAMHVLMVTLPARIEQAPVRGHGRAFVTGT